MRTALAALGTCALLSACTSACTSDEVHLGTPHHPTIAPQTTSTAAPVRPLPDFDADLAMRTVQHLAGEIGPRLATGTAFREAAAYVEEALAAGVAR